MSPSHSSYVSDGRDECRVCRDLGRESYCPIIISIFVKEYRNLLRVAQTSDEGKAGETRGHLFGHMVRYCYLYLLLIIFLPENSIS